MTCKKCGKKLKRNDKFCGSCGAPVPRAPVKPTCPKCGKKLDADSRFCNGCGAAVNGGAGGTGEYSWKKGEEQVHWDENGTGSQKKKKWNAWKVLCIPLTFLVVLFVLIGLFGEDNSSASKPSQPYQMDSAMKNELDAQIEALKNDSSSASKPTFTDVALYLAQENGESEFIWRDGTAELQKMCYRQDYATELTNGAGTGQVLERYFENSLTADGKFKLIGQKTLMNGDKQYGYYWFEYQEADIVDFGYALDALDFSIDSADLLYYYWEQDNNEMLLTCWYSKDLAMLDSALLDKTPVKAETPAQSSGSASNSSTSSSASKNNTTSSSSSDASVLPSFIDCDRSGKFEMKRENHGDVYGLASCTKTGELLYVVEEYIDRLEDMGYEITYEESKDFSGGDISYDWTLSHDAVDGTVLLDVDDWGDKIHKIYVTITYSGDITMKGISTSSNGGSSGGSSSSGIDWSSDDDNTNKYCSKCHNSGKIECDFCNGEGGKYVTDNSIPNYSGSTRGPLKAETWEDCFKCHGNKVIDCPRC